MTGFGEVCEELARRGGEVLTEWRGRFQVREKGPSDLVTEADLAAQEVIQGRINEVFPDHAFLGEEDLKTAQQQAAQLDGEQYLWVVDPLDGTTNYAHGLPHYAVSVALVHRRAVLAAAVYNPASEDCYTATPGEGAWLNGRRIFVSEQTALADALVAASFPPRIQANSLEITQLLKVIDASQAIRRTGSAALNMCQLAAGHFDAYWATKTSAWDVAAGWLLVQEAGGTVSGLDGGPFELTRPTPIVAATEHLHQQLVELLNSC